MFNKQDWWEWNHRPKSQATLFTIPDFHYSKTLVLTECYLVNHWWIAIIQTFGPSIFYWLHKIEQLSYLYLQMYLKAVDIWFGKSPRKPPDIVVSSTPSSFVSLAYYAWLDTSTLFNSAIDSFLYLTLQWDVNISYWTWFICSFILEQIKDFLESFFGVNLLPSDINNYDSSFIN
jgi:hypothetical protein